ncbi:MAG TPA: DUF2017 family protein [Acidimicrobiales bacterium]|nr:DUF2017 family protein [Acidimicrobiales bacterium]
MGDDGARQLSPLFNRRLIRWDSRAGVFRVEMDSRLREVLRELMQQFLSMLDDPDSPVLKRVFPPAYSDPAHVALQDEYRRLTQEDLVERRRVEVQTVLDSVEARVLSEEQVLAWSRAVNGLRLALGTYLDVKEEEPIRMPRNAEESAYQWLSWLLEETVEALSGKT